MSVQNRAYWALHNELMELIDVAMRWPMDGVYATVTVKYKYSMILSNVEDLQQHFNMFLNQFKERLDQTNNRNDLGIELCSLFLGGIDSYLKWYESNVEKTRRFEPHNPYETIHIICRRTKDIILSHFGNLQPYQKNKTISQTKTEKPKGYVDQMTEQQKKVVDQLLTSGFVFSHVFHLLKSKGFFTLTERQFLDYLNKYHDNNIDIEKRITSSKNLKPTIELEEKFNDLMKEIS